MAGGSAADPAAVLPAWMDELAVAAADPVAEMLTLVWGPRFDREHALALLARLPQVDGAWLQAIHAFGERFDALPPSGQRALRRDLLRFAHNGACGASC